MRKEIIQTVLKVLSIGIAVSVGGYLVLCGTSNGSGGAGETQTNSAEANMSEAECRELGDRIREHHFYMSTTKAVVPISPVHEENLARYDSNCSEYGDPLQQ